MTKLSKNFHDHEFACPCCNRAIVSDILISKLQKLRDIIGEPIHITSGYRCFAENDRVGGALNSAHTKGYGVDIQTRNKFTPNLPVVLAYTAAEIKGIRIGIYPNHIHIDIMPASPSKYWLVKKYGQKPIYSGNENNLVKFLKKNL